MMTNSLVFGILAHVDAGKTTLSEAILYKTGAIRSLGRVDHKTAFLDNNSVEKDRGITVFSKEARFNLGTKNVVLLDTPGHSDFSSEAERTLGVLDYAVLVISAADGVQGHTLTLWHLLETYGVPVFIFVNKMDQIGTDREEILSNLMEELGGGVVEFQNGKAVNLEDVAVLDEEMLKMYLEEGTVSDELICNAIEKREVFPVSFGSALKMEGIEEFLNTIDKYSENKSYGQEFGARVYKITRDSRGVRQTHLKVTGGSLKNKMIIKYGDFEEKVEQIRLYSGRSFDAVQEVNGGEVCAVTGLSATYAGQALGAEAEFGESRPLMEPALTYSLVLPDGIDYPSAMRKLKQLEEEDPSLNIVWNETLREIHVKVMGSLELEVLQRIIKERFDLDVSFGEGSVIYKETIESPVIGIGHFEPLRHYAEAHILMEPLPRGSGIEFDTIAAEDKLDKNWQRLIMTHLKEKEHLGVLTGSPVCDIKMTIIAGRAHLKHTEGGDFRQATYRAIRQGLMKAQSILLEPFYKFKAVVPNESVGKVLSDMQRLGASCSPPEMKDMNTSVVEGRGPVCGLQDYQKELVAYTRGKGSFYTFFDGYDRCHNEEEVIARMGYDPEGDIDNPPGSIFCSHGSGEYCPWHQVDESAHVDSGYVLSSDGKLEMKTSLRAARVSAGVSASDKELEEIFLRTYGKSKRDEALRRQKISKRSHGIGKPEESPLPQLIKTGNKMQQEYLIVDGYNVIFAWEELKKLAAVNLDSAREELLEILQNYMSYKNIGMVVVFDGYKVSGNPGTKLKYGDLEVVYTKEAETADRFIEKTAFEMGRKHSIKVITSDRPVQMAAMGDGAMRMSAREFYEEVASSSDEIRQRLVRQKKSPNRPFEDIF